jgi:sporulation protein YlmC with PRC-barrel domain
MRSSDEAGHFVNKTFESKEIHMKKLQTLAFYALATPIALGVGPVLAQSTGQDMDRTQQSSPRDPGATTTPSSPRATPAIPATPSTGSAGQPGSQSAADRSASGQAHMQNKGFMSSAPARGMHADNLIGAKVKTSAGEDVGPVTDLIINENGQVVAIVISVGGFLGMGERHVAIGWDDVTRSGSADDLVLQISSTRDALRSAPEFKKLKD